MKNLKTIKTSALMLFCALTMFFTACSKDDDPKFSIVGLWSFIEADAEIYVNGKDFVSYMVDAGVPSAFAKEAYNQFKVQIELADFGDIEFKADGTFAQTDPDTNETYTGTWEVNDDNTELTLKDSVEVVNFEITKLTETELHIAASESQKEDIDGDGKLDTIKVQMVFSLEK